MTTGFLETPESEKSYGYVTCRIIRRVADTPDDADAFPTILPAEGTVVFIPKQKNVTASNYSALVLNETIEAPLNSEGYAVRYRDADTTLIALAIGTYDVRFNIVSGGDIPPMTVQVTSNHTQETPLDLATIRPPAENDHTTVQIISVDPSVVDGSVLIKSGASVYGVPQSEFIGPLGPKGEPGEPGADGRGVESITDDDEDGIATVLYTDGATGALPLPRGPQGDPAPPPEIAWAGDVLTVDGVPSPPLSGPAGPAPVTSWSGTSLIVGDNPPVDLRGPVGERGPGGSPGAVATSTDYLLVGPGRPDTPATTGDIITGSEPVGAEYRSTDGAGVGAWVWMKRPTGWAVVDGDTRWRDITETSEEGISGTFYIRRIGAVVHFVARRISGPSGHPHLGIDGFRASIVSTNSNVAALADNSTTVVGQLKVSSSQRFPYWASPGRDTGMVSLSYPAGDSWPTSLPGTPA